MELPHRDTGVDLLDSCSRKGHVHGLCILHSQGGQLGEGADAFWNLCAIWVVMQPIGCTPKVPEIGIHDNAPVLEMHVHCSRTTILRACNLMRSTFCFPREHLIQTKNVLMLVTDGAAFAITISRVCQVLASVTPLEHFMARESLACGAACEFMLG